MARKIYRVISWGLLALTLWSLLLMLRKPSLPPVEASAQAAKSFDSKLSQLEEAHHQGVPQDIQITETELNSKLQESLESGAAPTGAVSVKAATVRLEGDRLTGTFTVNVSGKDLYLTMSGNLSARNDSLEFKPTEMLIGTLPVPLSLVESTLRKKLDSPEMRERMKLPDSIKGLRIENGELILQAQ